MAEPRRAHVRRALALLEGALPNLVEAAAAVPRTAGPLRHDADRAVHYLRRAIERAHVLLASKAIAIPPNRGPDPC